MWVGTFDGRINDGGKGDGDSAGLEAAEEADGGGDGLEGDQQALEAADGGRELAEVEKVVIGADLFEDAEEGVLVLHGAGGFGRDFDVEGSFRDRRLEALPRIPEPRRAGDEAEGVVGDDLEQRLARGAAKEDRAFGDAGGFVNADDAGQVVGRG